jgi:molecular chaperone DnaK
MTPKKYGEADKARKAIMVGSTRAESVANNIERALKDFEDELDKDEAENIGEKITALRDSSITAQHIKEQTDALQAASLTLFDKMHRARSEQQGWREGGDGEKKE